MTGHITAGEFKAKVESLLAIASALDPRIALAATGYETLKDLFGKTGELQVMSEKVYAETVETAPHVAQEVSAFFTAKGDAMLDSFKKHPGS